MPIYSDRSNSKTYRPENIQTTFRSEKDQNAIGAMPVITLEVVR